VPNGDFLLEHGSKSAAATSRRSTISSRATGSGGLPWGASAIVLRTERVTELLVRGIEAGHQQRLLMLPPGLADSPWRDSHMRAARRPNGRVGGPKIASTGVPQPPPVGDAGIVADVERGLRQQQASSYRSSKRCASGSGGSSAGAPADRHPSLQPARQPAKVFEGQFLRGLRRKDE